MSRYPSTLGRTAFLLAALTTAAKGQVYQDFGSLIRFPKPPVLNPIQQAPYDLHPASLAQLQWLVNMLRDVELDDSRRLDRILREQEWKARGQIRRYQDDLRGTRRITVGGQPEVRTLKASFANFQRFADEPAVYAALSTPVETLPKSEFAITRTSFGCVQQHGELVRLPRFFQADKLCREADAEVRVAWRPVYLAIANESLATYEQEEFLQSAVARLRQAARDLLSRSRHSSEKFRGEKYLRAVSALPGFLANEALAEELVVFAGKDGVGFPGGTVRDLISHVDRNHLTVRAGSRAQEHLQAVAYNVEDHLRDQIAQQTEWLEVLKQQHHWHDWVGPWEGGGSERGAGLQNALNGSMGDLLTMGQ